MPWWQIALYVLLALAGAFGLFALLFYAAWLELVAIDRENEDEPTEHGGRPL